MLAWLQEIELESYFGLLVKHGFDDLDYLNFITEEDLIKIGIMDPQLYREKVSSYFF